MASLSMGCAAVDITPRLGSRFVGHLNRKRPAEAVLDRLEARALRLSVGTEELLYLNFDLLEFGPAEAVRLLEAAARSSGLDPGRIILSATHTHTGPAVIGLAGQPADQSYLAHLEAWMLEAIDAAGRSRQPVHLRAGRAQARLGINRRLVVDGRVVMAPNPAGQVDHEVQLLLFETDNSSPAAVLVNYAVHPTTLGVGLFVVSADYPGRLRTALQRRFGQDCVVFFVQGACGDVKPAVFAGDGGFKEGGEADIEGLGKALAAAVETAARTAQAIAVDSIRTLKAPFSFRYERTPSPVELAAELARCEREIPRLEAPGAEVRGHIDPLAAARVMRGWAAGMLELSRAQGLPAAVESELRFFSLGGQVGFAGIPGEMFSETGLAIKAASPFAHTLIGGYSGGSLGYFPTAAALAEGGYEASDAFKFYGHPAAFAPETAAELVSACTAGLKRLFLKRGSVGGG